MNYLLAKVKRVKNPVLYKLISDYTLFNFDLNRYSLVEYSPDHNLDEDSLFKVSNFTECEFCLSYLKQQFTSASYNRLKLVGLYHT